MTEVSKFVGARHVKKILKIAALLTALLGTQAMAADMEALKNQLQKTFGLSIESVEPTPYANLYEVITSDTILYTDEKGSFVLAGSLIDSKTLENLTDKSLKKLAIQDFKKFPLDKAIKTVYGNGERKIITFEDPNCGFCRRLYGEMPKVDNVTVYTFLVPILGSDSVKKVRDIWCSEDRSATWKAWMKDRKTPATAKACDEPTEEVMTYARKIQLQGTPVILMENGERMNGYGTAEMIKEALNKS